MKMKQPIPNDRPIVDAMRCAIPDDAPIWMKGPPKPIEIIKTPLQPGVFMTDFRNHKVKGKKQ